MGLPGVDPNFISAIGQSLAAQPGQNMDDIESELSEMLYGSQEHNEDDSASVSAKAPVIDGDRSEYEDYDYRDYDVYDQYHDEKPTVVTKNTTMLPMPVSWNMSLNIH